MELDWFLSRNEILIDDAGWGDLVLGVVIGALKRARKFISNSEVSTPELVF